MERVFVEALNSVTTVDAEVPTPAEGEVLVRTTRSGICGSDTHAVAGHHPLLPPPYYPGHEAAGVVEALGPGVDGPAVGQRVMLKPNIACGECVNCRAGRTNACQTLAWIGCDPSNEHPGAMAEFFLAPAKNLYPVGEDVNDDQAVLVECLATPVHAVRLAGDVAGANVVVLGAGTIGLFAVIAARHAGAGTIVATDLDESKRRRALRHGAHAAVDPMSPTFAEDIEAALGGKADVVFDCVANQYSAAQAISVLRRAGSLMIVGVPPRNYEMPMPYVQDWELRVQGCANYTEDDVVAALAMATDIPDTEIVSGHYPFGEATRAFAEATQNSSGKVVVGPFPV